jgi:hypothetical protein
MAALHTAIGHDMREEAAETLDGVERGRTGAGTTHVPVGEGDGAVGEAHETAVGESDPEDRRGEGSKGGGALVRGLTVDMPGDGPHLGVDLLQEAGVVHVFFEDGAGERGEGFYGDKEVSAGGLPGRAVLRESTARNDVVEVRVVLALPAPGRQDARETREVCPDTARVCGQALEGRGRRVHHGLVRGALRRAEAGSERCRDRAGAEEVRPRELWVQVVVEPLWGCMRLPLGTVAVATGMRAPVWLPAGLARREARAVMAAAAVWDGAHAPAVCEGKVGGALQGLWRNGGKAVAEGGHGRSPCRRALRRS